MLKRSKSNGRVKDYGFGSRGKKPKLSSKQLKNLAIIRLLDYSDKNPMVNAVPCIDYLINQ
jgi:hypothetical protein